MKHGVNGGRFLGLGMVLRLLLCACAVTLGASTAAAQGGGAAGGAAGAGSATSGAAGAASGQTAGAPAAPSGTAAGAGQVSSSDVSQQAAAYAASAAPGTDPRRPPAATPGALTLAQVVERARAQNPTLLAAQANLRAVRAQEVQAAVRANPYFGIAAADLNQPATANNPYNVSVQVSRLFERGNKRTWRMEDARATTAQTEAQLNDTVRQTLLQVKTAFTHMLFARQALDLSRAQLADFHHEVEIAQARYQAGDLGKLDYERLDLQLGAFESDVANNEIAYLQASDQLQTLMGIATPSPAFDVTGDIVPPVVQATREQLLQAAMASRPDIAAAHAGVNAAQAAYRVAVANGTADPTVEGEYERLGTVNSYGGNVNIPVRIFDRNQGNKQTARLQVDNARLTEEAARNQVTSDVDQAWVGYTRARVLSDRFGQHYLDESADVLGIARFAFDHGGLALIDYLDALRDARTSTSDALNAYQQTWLAIHQLSAASATEVLP